MNIKSLQGIFPVFKPSGITSAQLLEVIKINLRKGLYRLTLPICETRLYSMLLITCHNMV